MKLEVVDFCIYIKSFWEWTNKIFEYEIFYKIGITVILQGHSSRVTNACHVTELLVLEVESVLWICNKKVLKKINIDILESSTIFF